MIKPTHYDDDDYPIQWLRSAIPSNTLACFNGLTEDARSRSVLGENVEIQLHTYDETNRRVRPEKIAAMIERAGGKALIGLVGVQSNQFPRALDLARRFRALGFPVMIGGFHVSGCISMLPEMVAVQEEGISFFAGEAEEHRLDQVFRDAWADEIKPLYDYMKDLPGLVGERTPILPSPAYRAHGRVPFFVRSGARLSLSVLVLHHHQRAGAKGPVPFAGRSGVDHSRQPRARHQPLLHHG